MKNIFGLALVLSLIVLLIPFAQAAEFQTGKIVAVERQASSTLAGGTDAPTAANKHRYDLTIQVRDRLYVCRAETSGDNDLDWVQGKEAPVKIEGKMLSIKRANGKIAKLPILSSKKAD